MEGLSDTIAAICTPCGGAIAVLRISGPRALAVCSKFCLPKNGKNFMDIAPRQIEFCSFVCEDKRLIDEVLVCFFKAPSSFTGEDTVEIYCHGGELMPRVILEKLCFGGARLAYAGEFTRRAFINGKLDLTQAEAIADIVSAKTDRGLFAASSQLSGGLGSEVKLIRDIVLDLSSHILAVIDFPDEGVEDCSVSFVLSRLEEIWNRLSKLCESFKSGRIICKGINAVLCGSPNVGKSSVFNNLLGCSRAIVTDKEGTTRDLINESISLDGHLINLTDTAGIRNAEEEAEKIGVELSYSSIDKADVLIIVLDVSRHLNSDEVMLLESTVANRRIIVINKMDKESRLFDSPSFCGDFYDKHGFDKSVYLNSLSSENLDKLKDRLVSFCDQGVFSSSENMVTNERQYALLTKALGTTESLVKELNGGLPLDLALDDLTQISALLGGVTGDDVSDEVIDRIFSNFCVGK